jgi:phosphoglycerol transferase MdoB-like AlkP superfamily enzyme
MDLENSKKINNYIKVLFLPLLLAVLFVLQSQLFNYWLGIYSDKYYFRLSLVAFALGVIFYWPALFFKKKYKYFYLLLVSFLVSILFIAQFLYYKYSQSFLQFSAIKYMGQADSIAGTIIILISPELLFFVINIFIVVISYMVSIKRKSIEFIIPNWEKTMIIVVMIMIVFFGYKYLLDTEKKEWGSTSRLYTDVYDLKSLVGKIGITNFFLEDTYKYILRSNLVSAKDKNSLDIFAGNRVTAEEGKYFGKAKGKNLIIIQVESLENVVINRKIGDQEVTPNLNRLAKEGLYFNNYYAQVGPGNTADTEFSTLNSLYPLPDDVVFINYAKNTYNALPKVLVSNGYSTYSLHGDVPTFWNRSNIYPGLGYQKSYGLADYIVTKSVGKGPSDLGDEDLFSQSLSKLENFKNPFMATLITMSSHTPFILPNDLQELKVSPELKLGWIQEAYLQSINYTDKTIGQFIEGLKNDGLYDNSLIVIIGDHGSFTGISTALSQENILPELSNSQVPMIILNSGLENKIIDKPGSQIDNYPTIANLLGVVAPKSIFGQDILNTKTPIETHFEPVSGGIDAILTSNISYQADKSGEFSLGICKSIIDKKILPITDCQKIYLEQLDNLKASNTIVRGNLLFSISK